MSEYHCCLSTNQREPSFQLQKHKAYLQLLNLIKYIQMSLTLPFNFSIITLIDKHLCSSHNLCSGVDQDEDQGGFYESFLQVGSAEYHQPFCDYFSC